MFVWRKTELILFDEGFLEVEVTIYRCTIEDVISTRERFRFLLVPMATEEDETPSMTDNAQIFA